MVEPTPKVPLQLYVVPVIFELAVNTELLPKHIDDGEAVAAIVGNGSMVTVTLPVILLTHDVVAFVATTVYVPATV